MNYTGRYKSNQVQVSEVSALKRRLRAFPDSVAKDGESEFSFHGVIELSVTDDEADTGQLELYSPESTFQALSPGYEEDLTTEFLALLSTHLEAPLLIRSIGGTGVRHIPDAYQYRVEPNPTGEPSDEYVTHDRFPTLDD